MKLEALQMFSIVLNITMAPEDQTLQYRKMLVMSTTHEQCIEEAFKYHGILMEMNPDAYMLTTRCEWHSPLE